jgi:hypothetical protein
VYGDILQITKERKKWAKFGLAATAGNQGVTGQHAEQIMFERTNTTKKEEKKDAASAAKVHMVCFPSFAATSELLLIDCLRDVAGSSHHE